MISKKNFWKVSEVQLSDAYYTEVMYVDNKPLLWRYLADPDDEDDEDSEVWHDMDKTEAHFFSTKEEATAFVNETRANTRKKIEDAVKVIETYYDTCEIIENLEGEEKAKFAKIDKRYRKYCNMNGEYTEYEVMGIIRDALDFVMNRRGMHGTTQSFMYKDIDYVEDCKDETNNRHFKRVHLKGGKVCVTVYDKDALRILKSLYGSAPRINICNGELNFLK